MKDMRYVKVSSFINQKNISYKILVSIVLCFLVVFTSQFDLSFNLRDTARNTIDFIYGIGDNSTNGGNNGLQRIAGSGITESVFGDPSLAEMGSENLDMIIKQSGYEINLDDVKEPERRDFDDLFPDDVFVESSDIYEENIEEEKQEIVKSYFLKLAEEE